MARTSSIYDHFDLYLTTIWPLWPSTYLKKCFKWHFSSSRATTVPNCFEIHALLYKLWSWQIRTGARVHAHTQNKSCNNYVSLTHKRAKQKYLSKIYEVWKHWNNISDCFVSLESTYRNTILDVANSPASVTPCLLIFNVCTLIFHARCQRVPSRESRMPFYILGKNPAGYFVLTGSNSLHKTWAPKFWPGPRKKKFRHPAGCWKILASLYPCTTGDNHVSCVQLSKPDVGTLSYRRSHYWWQKERWVTVVFVQFSVFCVN